jgi:hypothetical protein
MLLATRRPAHSSKAPERVRLSQQLVLAYQVRLLHSAPPSEWQPILVSPTFLHYKRVLIVHPSGAAPTSGIGARKFSSASRTRRAVRSRLATLVVPSSHAPPLSALPVLQPALYSLPRVFLLITSVWTPRTSSTRAAVAHPSARVKTARRLPTRRTLAAQIRLALVSVLSMLPNRILCLPRSVVVLACNTGFMKSADGKACIPEIAGRGL